MAVSPRYLVPTLPEGLEDLGELALDLRWSWSHYGDEVWERIDPVLWDITHNPWLILQTVGQSRLQELADDRSFRGLVKHHLAARREALDARTWFAGNYPEGPLRTGAYFSMEFGLSEALPIYSGGLGILAGDYLKAASDLGVPVVGVGLLYQQGYFRQALDSNGDQIELYPFNDPGQLPLLPVRNGEGEWLSVSLEFPRRLVHARVWAVKAGRVDLYLLDTNTPINSPADRGITSELYGGGQEIRLQQELVLGIGGWRVLEALHIEPDICHLNEGHAAFAILERANSFIRATGVSFEVALMATRPGNLFTTHTPVAAGFDRFSPALIEEYLGPYAAELGIGLEGLLALGRQQSTDPHEPFNMAYLAIRGSGAVNGVSRLHGEVSRRLFQPLFPRLPVAETPVGYVTNGVHVPSWDSPEADRLWTNACGKSRWLGSVEPHSACIGNLTDEEIWDFRTRSRNNLVQMAREHVARQGPIAGSLEAPDLDLTCLCNPGYLTLGFARRFTSYKRCNLLLHDPDRLVRILNDEARPVQLLLAGKAHPADDEGQAMIRQWAQFIRRPDVRPRVVFLVDYDMAIAEHLLHGVDVWVNTPRRPWEACGTSGMKILANGGLNLSELDGWWAEAYSPDAGWAIGDGQEHSWDPDWDRKEAEQLYGLLENEVIPEFYDRDERGISARWVARIRESMARLAPHYSTNRMLAEYLDTYYVPGSLAYRERAAADAAEARSLVAWVDRVERAWPALRFGEVRVATTEATHHFAVDLHLPSLGRAATGLSPEDLSVELYAEPLGPGGSAERIPMEPMADGPAAPRMRVARITYVARVPSGRPATDYTPRALPAHPALTLPLELPLILWEH